MMAPSHMAAVWHTFLLNQSDMTKFASFELVLIQQTEVDKHSQFFSASTTAPEQRQYI